MGKSFVKNIPCIRVFKNKQNLQIQDSVITEERIALYLNGVKILSTMSIPVDQDAHAVGFLFSEGVIEKIEDLKSVEISEDGLCVRIEASIQESNLSNLYHEKTLTSGCCVGVTGNFEGKIIEKFIDSQICVDMQVIWKVLESFYQENDLFNQTGCVHKALLSDENGNVIAQAYDVGRHNAIDKVVGKTKLNRLKGATILFVSGRLSLEMVIKAVMHEIPIVVSKAATTKLAIQSAQKLGITLIGFAREGRCNIYTHSSRIMCH